MGSGSGKEENVVSGGIGALILGNVEKQMVASEGEGEWGQDCESPHITLLPTSGGDPHARWFGRTEGGDLSSYPIRHSQSSLGTLWQSLQNKLDTPLGFCPHRGAKYP
jgi:hypothetical protein